jgi:hypothetical protein
MTTQKKQGYGDQGAKRGVTGEKMDESLENDFDETGAKGGDIGREWDESDQSEGNEPVIHVELDDQGNLKEGEEE